MILFAGAIVEESQYDKREKSLRCLTFAIRRTNEDFYKDIWSANADNLSTGIDGGFLQTFHLQKVKI